MLFKLACFMTGDNPDLVDRYDVTSRKKICLQALNLLIPTSIWFLCGFGAVYVILQKPLWLSLFTGVLMATFIFIIDRTIISMPGSWKVNLMRLGIGALMSVLGATIVDLLIFDDEIRNEIAETTDRHANSIAVLRTQRVQQEVDRQQKTVRELFDLWKEKEQQYVLEATGKLSGHRGVDTIARSIKAQAYEFEMKHRTAQQRLDSAQAALSGQLVSEQEAVKSDYRQSGILNRINALDAILDRDHVSKWAYYLMTAICLLLELSVILFKILMPQSPYDDKNDKYRALMQKRLSY